MGFILIKNHIKEYRKKEGLTQYELAQKIDLTRRGVIYLENHAKDINLSTAMKLSKVLKVSIDDLFEMDD